MVVVEEENMMMMKKNSGNSGIRSWAFFGHFFLANNKKGIASLRENEVYRLAQLTEGDLFLEGKSFDSEISFQDARMVETFLRL